MANYSKADLRFWQDSVFRHVRRVSEKNYEDLDYSVRMQHKGHRCMFALSTPRLVIPFDALKPGPGILLPHR